MGTRNLGRVFTSPLTIDHFAQKKSITLPEKSPTLKKKRPSLCPKKSITMPKNVGQIAQQIRSLCLKKSITLHKTYEQFAEEKYITLIEKVDYHAPKRRSHCPAKSITLPEEVNHFAQKGRSLSSKKSIHLANICNKVLSSPWWNAHASFVDSCRLEVSSERLGLQNTKWIARTSENWGFKELMKEMKKYSKRSLPDDVEEGI